MDILILASQIELFDTSYRASERSFYVLVKGAKDTKREGQKSLFRVFSGPQLAKASL